MHPLGLYSSNLEISILFLLLRRKFFFLSAKALILFQFERFRALSVNFKVWEALDVFQNVFFLGVSILSIWVEFESFVAITFWSSGAFQNKRKPTRPNNNASSKKHLSKNNARKNKLIYCKSKDTTADDTY